MNNAIYANINDIDSFYLFPSYYQWVEPLVIGVETELLLIDILGSFGIENLSSSSNIYSIFL